MTHSKQKAYFPSSSRAGAQALRALLEKRPPRAIDIARAGGFSPQYVHQVLRGDRPPSARFVEATRSLGFPVDLIWPGAGK